RASAMWRSNSRATVYPPPPPMDRPFTRTCGLMDMTRGWGDGEVSHPVEPNIARSAREEYQCRRRAAREARRSTAGRPMVNLNERSVREHERTNPGAVILRRRR